MGAAFGKGKKEVDLSPIYIPDARKPSYTILLRSPEVLGSLVAMILCSYLIVVYASATRMKGPSGLWMTFARKSHARLQSREAELLPEPPLALSLDFVLIAVAAMSVTSFLRASSRVVEKEQQRLDDEQATERRRRLADKATRKTVVAEEVKELDELVKLFEENDKRVAANQVPRRQRVRRVDVMADDFITNVIVVLAITLASGMAIFVQMNHPNYVRACGSAIMLVVLIGGMLVCGVDHRLKAMQHYCGIVDLVCIGFLLTLAVRATVLAQ